MNSKLGLGLPNFSLVESSFSVHCRSPEMAPQTKAQTCRICYAHQKCGVKKRGHKCPYNKCRCVDCKLVKEANKTAAAEKKARPKRLLSHGDAVAPGKRRPKKCINCRNHNVDSDLICGHSQICKFANCDGSKGCNCTLTEARKQTAKAQIFDTRHSHPAIAAVVAPVSALPSPQISRAETEKEKVSFGGGGK